MSEIRVNNVVDEGGTKAPAFTYGIEVPVGYGITGAGGINVSGMITAGAGINANSTGLTGTPSITVDNVVGAAATLSGIVKVSNTTESTDSTNGSLVISGGVGIAKSLNVGGNVTVGGTLTYEDVTNQDVLGLSTFRGGVQFGVSGVGGTISAAGNAELVGIVTAGIVALDAISEQLVRIDGNTATITYSSGGANIGYCTSPTGDITLSVTGIPTSSFDNQAITFSLIVDNSTANAAGVRTCNAVKLNHVTKTIRWSGGTVGTGNTAAYDIFNFTGINTVGSGSTTANYEVFGLVNGDFRLY